ncbi:hypothetical protein [Pedobacter heparinus]|uniref:hypothetical protein n=1 Tax=Pedobacter heparinus TaxID=984 RepID=UPI002931DCE1|nr:hypothetical protein [Pedobacter heparinus]
MKKLKMKNYLIIDHSPSANKTLHLDLFDLADSIFRTDDPEDIRMRLSTGRITAVFVRLELWDHRLFEDVLSLSLMPELVLLGNAKQEPVACCGYGLPHFLADDCSVEDLKGTLNYVNSSFIQSMEFRFILAKDGDRVFKIDLNQIISVEAVKNGSLIHTACGVFVSAQTIDELELLLPKAPVS